MATQLFQRITILIQIFGINIDFIPTTHKMDVYCILSKIYFSEVKDYISNFYEMFRNIHPGTHASISYELPPDYPYMYIAFCAEGDWLIFNLKLI